MAEPFDLPWPGVKEWEFDADEPTAWQWVRLDSRDPMYCPRCAEALHFEILYFRCCPACLGVVEIECNRGHLYPESRKLCCNDACTLIYQVQEVLR